MAATKTLWVYGNQVSVEVNGPITYNFTVKSSVYGTVSTAGHFFDLALTAQAAPDIMKGDQYAQIFDNADSQHIDSSRGPNSQQLVAQVRMEYDTDATPSGTSLPNKAFSVVAPDNFSATPPSYGGILELKMSGNIKNQYIYSAMSPTGPTSGGGAALDGYVDGNGTVIIRLPFLCKLGGPL